MKAVTQGLCDLVSHWSSLPAIDPRIYRRVYVGPNKEIPEGVERCEDISALKDNSVNELLIYNAVERIADLASFWRHCYRVLKMGCNMTVSGFYHRHEDCRLDPTRVRGLEEKMFYALAKDWREENAKDPFEDDTLLRLYDGIDFGIVSMVHAGEPMWLGKSDLARAWGHAHYQNVTRRLDVVLIKR